MSKAGGAGDSSKLQLGDIETILGKPVAQLIDFISQTAQEKDLAVYLAGGVARDLLLRRQTLDLDIVLEGDAVRFAKLLAKRVGGTVLVHKQFGTAKWRLDESVAHVLALRLDALPASVDFVAARSETYARPAALPTVSPSDIGRDLRRRDFSVNALAIQLSPLERAGALLHVCGGMDDLQRGLIRALHDQSFVDDPTRLFRALRYARRLGFAIEPRTGEWMRAALPLLGRLSGQRLRNELDLILRENGGGEIVLALQELGALAQIHPAFHVSRRLPALLARVHEFEPPWSAAPVDRQSLRWHLLLAGISAHDVLELCGGLALTKALTRSIAASARLETRAALLEDGALHPSQISRFLDEFPDSALQVCWLLWEGQSLAQERIAAYASDWRQRRPRLSGKDLIEMGIAPGPRYRQILDRLRFARLDGEVRSREDEIALLKEFVEAGD